MMQGTRPHHLNTTPIKQPSMSVHLTRAHILLSLFLIIVSSSGGLTEEPDGLKKVWDPTNETLTICSDSGTPYLSIQQLSTAPDLTTFTEIFNITSYVTHTLDPSKDFRSTWAQFKGTSGITGIDWYIQKNESYSTTVNDYGEVTNSQIIPGIIEYENITDTWVCEDDLCNLGDCSSDQEWRITRTTANGTETGIVCFDWYEVLDSDPLRIKVHWTSTGIIGSHTETKYHQVWKPFSPVGKTIHPDKSYIIKVVYHKKPEIGESNIQLIPMFWGLWCEELTWWNTSWSHRKVITLTGGASGAQTNYQLLLNITYDSDMQADFDDLRFANATHQVDAWLESNTTDYALIWVKFPTTPANGVNQTYYMYYGKADAVSDWDIEATFLFGDDFLDVFPGTKWTGATGYGSVTGGILSYTGDGTWQKIFSDVSTTPDMAMRCKAKLSTFADNGQSIGFEKTPCCEGRSVIYNTGLITSDDAGASQETTGLLSAATWYTLDLLQISGTSVELLADGVSKVTHTTRVGTIAEPASIASRVGGIDVDWVLVRKYVANPPTYAFGSEEDYVDSIHYNTTQPYNLTIDSNNNIASNRSIIAADDLNWSAQAVSDDCGFIVTEFNLLNITIANFTVYTANLDWLQVTNLTVDATYNLTNGTTYEHQTADASGEANFTTDLIPGDYQIFGPGITPVITLLSQTPSVLYENSTGYLNISYSISHDEYGLNNTSVSFLFRNYDHTLNDANHSIRPPANDKCAVWEYNGQIIRAANRNESLNFENNDTITGGDIYTWSGLDENQTRLTVVPINSTYTIVNINGTVHDLAMEQMWYLDRTSMVEAPKTQLAIHKTQDVLIKFWDAEIFKGNYDFIGAGYTDTSLGALQPSDADPISFYYLNSSYDPLGGVDPLDSNYAVFMGSLNATQWIDHTYSPGPNASYVRGLINNTMLHSVINTTEISYLYFRSNTPTSKPYYINITNANTGTNLTFGQTGVLWIGDDAPYTAHPYTPNIWFAFIYQNTSFDHKLYAAGASGLWSNSTLNRTYIGVGQFSPTKPYIDHFNYSGVFDYDMDGYYTGNFTIVGGVSTDPDGGTVTHNLTLHYANNLTLAAIINNTFTDADVIGNGVFAEIAFNSTPYLSDTVQYTLKLVATDDEGDTAETWLGVDFWLAERPPTPGFIFEIFALMIMFAAGMMMYSFLVVDPDNYTHVLAAFLSGIVYILSGFSAFSGIAFYGDDALLCTDQTGWVAMVFIILGGIMILYAAIRAIDTAKEVIEELEESTT
jgi:hypothetical protein